MFHKGTVELNAQPQVSCKPGNSASLRNPLLGCIGRVYGDFNTLLVDKDKHLSEMLWRHQ